MTTRREELENEGIKSMEILLDMETYGMLQRLMKKVGYDIDNGEKTEGVSGVLTQLIRNHTTEDEPIKLSRKRQRSMMLQGQIMYLKEDMEFSNEDVAELFNSKKGVRYAAKHDAKREKWGRTAIVRVENNKRIRNKSKTKKH